MAPRRWTYPEQTVETVVGILVIVRRRRLLSCKTRRSADIEVGHGPTSTSIGYPNVGNCIDSSLVGPNTAHEYDITEQQEASQEETHPPKITGWLCENQGTTVKLEIVMSNSTLTYSYSFSDDLNTMRIVLCNGG